MEKNAVLDAIRKRRSVRAYRGEMIPKSVVEQVVDAGLFAPFAGDQQCHFSVVLSKSKIDRINRTAKETARDMGVPHLAALGRNETFDCSYGAPVMIIVSAKEPAVAPEMDAAAAAENILIAAESLGLGACWTFFPTLAFCGADSAAMKREYAIEEQYKPHVAICLGYAGESPQVPVHEDSRATYIE